MATPHHKKMVIAERTKFIISKIELNEIIIQSIHNLQGASRFYDFEELVTGEMTLYDELIRLILVEGMCDVSYKHKKLD